MNVKTFNVIVVIEIPSFKTFCQNVQRRNFCNHGIMRHTFCPADEMFCKHITDLLLPREGVSDADAVAHKAC